MGWGGRKGEWGEGERCRVDHRIGRGVRSSRAGQIAGSGRSVEGCAADRSSIGKEEMVAREIRCGEGGGF